MIYPIPMDTTIRYLYRNKVLSFFFKYDKYVHTNATHCALLFIKNLLLDTVLLTIAIGVGTGAGGWCF